MSAKAKLQRLQRALRPHLAGGWERVVFAAPQSGDEGAATRVERVLSGPGAGVVPTAAQIEAVLAAAVEAAMAGLIKQTLVLDARRRIQVDARHGRATVRTLDEAAALKAMGGKERALRPDTSAALLREIGIMNADGSISAAHARKYKQVCHLATLCEPVVERLAGIRPITAAAPLRALDLACGNAYLSFVLAEVLRLRGVPLRLHGVDVRPDVVARSEARARALGLAVSAESAAADPGPGAAPVDPGPGAAAEGAGSGAAPVGLSFAVADIAGAAASARAQLGGVPDLVLALHACDTATDQAIALAIALGVPALLSVPCCQAEIAAQLARVDPAAHPLATLVEHGLLRRSYADVLTDSLRVAALEACGYTVTTLEFVGSEHTPKNLLIRAFRLAPRAPVDPGRWRLEALQARCAALGIRPDLLVRLGALQTGLSTASRRDG